MPWQGNIREEIAELFDDLDSYIIPSEIHRGWGNDNPALIVPFLPPKDRRYGCKQCGGPCVIVGKRWPHRRCMKCLPFRRIYDPSAYPCGHPRTQENTQIAGRAGPRCKACNRVKAREAARAKQSTLPRLTTSERHAIKLGHPYNPRPYRGQKRKSPVCGTCEALREKLRPPRKNRNAPEP